MKSQSLRTEAIPNILSARKTSMLEKLVTVPQTDTGELVENTKVAEIIFVKELGKLIP